MRLRAIATRYPEIYRSKSLAAVLLLTLCILPASAQFPDDPASSGSQATAGCADPVAAMSPQCMAVQPVNADTGRQYDTAPLAPGEPSPDRRGVNGQSYSDNGGLAGASGQNGRMASETPEPLSEFQKFAAATTGQVLPIFGANLFENAPSTFAPLDQGQVTADYLLGPGDELRIRVWGQVNFNAAVRIDRSGNIYLPQVGAVHVAGLPYASVQEHVRSEIARVFRNFDLTVDMGQLRSIQVFVVGQVRRPGTYTISSLSTLINAVFVSGGPTIQGSLRRIELKRQGQVVAKFDFYDLLLRGDKSKDVPLLPGDVIFVPSIGAQVALAGSVRHPAIYELGGNATLGQLLSDAGGASPLASTARISIERLDKDAGREAMEVGFDQAAMATRLHDGDLLRVISVVPAYQKTVTLRGNTANPGRFAWHPGMRLSELIPDRSSLLTRNYWWQRTRLGLPGAEFEPDVTGPVQAQPRYPVNLDSFACAPQTGSQGAQGDGAPSGDRNPVTGAPCTTSDRYNPSQIPPQYRAGVQGQATLSPNQVLRPQNSGASGSIASQQNQQVLENAQKLDLGYTRTDVKLSAPEIDWNYAVIERTGVQNLKTSLIPFNLGRLVMEHDPSQDLELQPGDVVSIFSQADIRVPVAEQTKFVRLEGEFVSAGVYSVKPGETLRELVKRAGGITPDAYLYGSEFTRESTRVLQQERLQEYVRTLEVQITRGSIEAASASNATPQDLQEANSAAAGEQQLIARLNEIRATGRIVFDLDANASSVDQLPDLPLEDGDRFILPSHPSTVNVVGAIYDQNSFLYQAGFMVRDYLHESGGPTRDADGRRAFIIRADGSVVSRQSHRSGYFNTIRMNPGDTIVVPEKTFRPSSLRSLIAYTQLFSQLALGAAAIDVVK